MRKLVLTLILCLIALPAMAQVRPAPSWLRYYLPIRPQVQLIPGVGGAGGTFNGGNVSGATSFLDGTNFQIKNTADATKILQVDLTGVTTGNTITPFAFAGTAAAPTITIPAGAAATPSLNFTGATTSGFWSRSAGIFDLSTGAAFRLEFGAIGGVSGISMSSDTLFGWGSTTAAGSAQDLLLNRKGAAILQQGKDLNGAAINQTFTACNGITGTDIAGCGLTLGAGNGTGAAVSNPTTLTRQIANATGTTAQTSKPALLTCISKILSNTTATTQAVAKITTTTTSAGAVTWFYTVVASNGTLLDSDAAEILVAWNNNAGTVAATAGSTVGGANSAASGTLASTPTASVATNVVSLNLAPAWTVIVPTTVTGFSTFMYNGATDTVTCQ